MKSIKNHKIRIFLFLALLVLGTIWGTMQYRATANTCATCSSYGTCTACKNCKYCSHCSKDGGTCSVCK